MSEETKPTESNPAAPSAAPEASAAAVAVENAEPVPLEGAEVSTNPAGLGLEHLFDIPLDVAIELGGTKLPIETIVKLGPGSVITLDRSTTEPVDVYVNGKFVAKGEVVTVGDRYGIRITSIQDAAERLKALG